MINKKIKSSYIFRRWWNDIQELNMYKRKNFDCLYFFTCYIFDKSEFNRLSLVILKSQKYCKKTLKLM